MAGTVPDEVMLARLRREAEARESLAARLDGLDEKIARLEARASATAGGRTIDSAAMIETAQRVVAEAGFAMAETIERLTARVSDGATQSEAGIEELRRVIATTDYALAEQTLTLHAKIAGNEAKVAETLTAYATKQFAEAKKTEALSAAADDAAAKVSMEAIARAEKDGIAAARWSVEVDANGKVAGLRIGSESNLAGTVARSSIDFKADVFRISTDDNDDGTAVAPFTLSGSTLELNALMVVNGQSLGSMQANSSLPPIHSIGDFVSPPAASGYPVNSVYHNTTDGHTYIRTSIGTWALFLQKGATGSTGATGAPGIQGDPGTPGTPGTPGARGSKAFFRAGSTWSNAEADAAISAAGAAPKVLLDQVTISNTTTFAETRFWDGSDWQPIGAVINGNMLVNGTLGAEKLVAHSIRGDHIEAHVELTSPLLRGGTLKLDPFSGAATICSNTDDGFDVALVRMNGGGADGDLRGGQVDCFGNEFAANPDFQGAITLTPGGVDTGKVYLRDKLGHNNLIVDTSGVRTAGLLSATNVSVSGTTLLAGFTSTGGAAVTSGGLTVTGSVILRNDLEVWSGITAGGAIQVAGGASAPLAANSGRLYLKAGGFNRWFLSDSSGRLTDIGNAGIQKEGGDGWTPKLIDGSASIEFQASGGALYYRINGGSPVAI